MKIMNKQGMVIPASLILIIIVGVLGYLAVANWGSITGKLSIDGETQAGEKVSSTRDKIELGTAATLYPHAYDREASAETEVYPIYYMLDSQGNKVLDGVGVNSTATSVGQVLTLHEASEDAAYYVDSKENFRIENTAPLMTLDAHKIATSSQITAYDNTGATALTADDNGTNEADYSLSLGANQKEIIYLKYEINDSNMMENLCAVCTYYGNNIDDFELIESGVTEVSIPEELKDATIAVKNDTTDETTNWKHCYKLASTVKLHEWDDVKYKFKVTASAIDPVANDGNNFGAVYLDCGYNKAKNGEITYDFYQHDDSELVSDIGRNEGSKATTDPFGLFHAVTIEGQ